MKVPFCSTLDGSKWSFSNPTSIMLRNEFPVPTGREAKGQMGPRASVDTMMMTKIPAAAKNQTPVIQSVVYS
jgi:hypothetical protein